MQLTFAAPLPGSPKRSMPGVCVAFTWKEWLSRSFLGPRFQIPVLAYLRL